MLITYFSYNCVKIFHVQNLHCVLKKIFIKKYMGYTMFRSLRISVKFEAQRIHKYFSGYSDKIDWLIVDNDFQLFIQLKGTIIAIFRLSLYESVYSKQASFEL